MRDTMDKLFDFLLAQTRLLGVLDGFGDESFRVLQLARPTSVIAVLCHKSSDSLSSIDDPVSF